MPIDKITSHKFYYTLAHEINEYLETRISKVRQAYLEQIEPAHGPIHAQILNSNSNLPLVFVA
jgi:hypothetical protein